MMSIMAIMSLSRLISIGEKVTEMTTRFIKINDSTIKDTTTGKEYWVNCENTFLYDINELNDEKDGYRQHIKQQNVHIKKLERDNIELYNENVALKHDLEGLIEHFDDKISKNSPIRDWIK